MTFLWLKGMKQWTKRKCHYVQFNVIAKLFFATEDINLLNRT